ncbi:hypothetical protein TNCV_4738911 [Trichonephila clavipes]|nr:hypothetical protein TNCV_4738911 [Trichonephila clavipes]
MSESLRHGGQISESHDVHFQWIPSHVNIFGNERADLLAKEGCNASPPTSSTLAYSEHQSRKSFALCTKCKIQKVSPNDILDCLGLSRENFFSSPLLLSSDLFSVWFGNSSKRHQARRRFVEWAQNEIAVVPDFHKRILFSDEAHFWLNGYVNKQNCRIGSEANPQVYVETPLHPEKLTVWCALWAGGIILQKR